MHALVSKCEPAEDFLIRCGECTLSAKWLPRYTNTAFPAWVRRLGVEGYQTPTKTVKYFPAVAAARWIMRVLFPKFNRNGRITVLVPSSGNFILSLIWYILEKNFPIDVIGVLSSKIPKGKRALIDAFGIKILTEIDLARILRRNSTADLFEMLYEYSHQTGIQIIDQYSCPDDNWNAESYRPIAQEVHEQVGEVAMFVSTAGSKGKSAIAGMLRELNGKTQLYAAYPYPGYSFPGGRGVLEQKKGKNSFSMEPVDILVDEVSAIHRSILACRARFYGGFTFGAEDAAAELALINLMLAGQLEGFRRKSDGLLIALLVASDTIFPCKEEAETYFPGALNGIEMQ